MESPNLPLPPHCYIAILRCRSWCVWPEHLRVISAQFAIYPRGENEKPAQFQLHLASYVPRTRPEQSLARPVPDSGPIIWRGNINAGYRFGNAFVKAPEDTLNVVMPFEPPFEGEIDIQLHIGSLVAIDSDWLEQFATSTTASLLSFINLYAGDFLVPVAPIHIRKLKDNKKQWDLANTFVIECRNRKQLQQLDLSEMLTNFVNALWCVNEPTSAEPSIRKSLRKLDIAFEIYAATFTERSTNVRFLMLVMTLESLIPNTAKPQIVQDVLARWKTELEELRRQKADDSDAAAALKALERELIFRKEDSIRSQIRSLVKMSLQSVGDSDANKNAKLALEVYDQRSRLVHEGKLPPSELQEAAKSAKQIVDAVLKALVTVALRGQPTAPTSPAMT